MIGTRRFRFFRFELQETDGFILLIFVLFTLLAGIFLSKVKNGYSIILANIAMAAVYLVLIYFRQKASSRRARFFLGVSPIFLGLLYIYETAHRFQHIFFATWKDQIIIDFEQAVLGVQPTVWLQNCISPGLTEWFAFSYLSYLPLYLVISAVIYYKRGERPLEDLLSTISINNIFCNLCYILFPVAGPFYKIGHLYSVPLNGPVFASIGEFMRVHTMPIGGSLPSGHCAAVTILCLTAYRHCRPLFFILTPIVLSLYISTVYGRYHYLTDVVLGILVGLFWWRKARVVRKGWDWAIHKLQAE
jgi:membrane-associated phospholipid phosphatase